MKKTMRGLPSDLEMTRRLGLSEIDYLMINLRGPCNYRCKKCFADSPPSINPPVGWNKTSDVIREARDLGARVVIIAGEGEPLIAPRIHDILELNTKLGLITILFTNASYLDEDMARFLKDHDCSTIISLDSLRKDTYQYLTQGRQHDLFEIVMKNIRFLRSILLDSAEISGGMKIVRAAVNMSLSLAAEKELNDMAEFCGDDLLFICNSLAYSGSAGRYWSELCGTDEDFQRLKEKAQKFSETGGCSAIYHERCANLYYGIAIGSEGSILPCAYTQDLSGAIGNIHDMSLEQAITIVKKYKNGVFEHYGSEPCIVRHKQYNAIVKGTRK